MSSLISGPAFKLCSEATLRQVRWNAEVAEVGVPLHAWLMAEGHPGTLDAFQRLTAEWALIQWSAGYLSRMALDEDVHRAIMARHGPIGRP